MNRLAVVLMCLALAGCGTASSQTKTVDPGTDVVLAPGQTAAVMAAPMSVRFIAVTEDSRCPRDTTCVWAGQVKLALEIQQFSQPAWQVEMLEGDRKVAGGYRVTLVRVDPQRARAARIAPGDYRATLAIDKVD